MSAKWNGALDWCWELLPGRLVGVAILAFLTLAPGCGQSAPSAGRDGEATAVGDSEKGITAQEILRRSAKAYQSAKSYSDQGELVVAFPGSSETSRFPFSVAFIRSGQLIRIAAYQVTLASDGSRMRGFIDDTLSNNLDGQFLDAPAPKQLAPENVIGDPEAASILSQGAGGPPPVLEWLLVKEPFKEVLESPERLKKLPSRELNGSSFYRVAIDVIRARNASPSGSTADDEHTQIVLWVNQKTWMVGRLEFPPIDASEGEVDSKKITITAELRDALVNGAVDESQFSLKPTKEAKVVGFFVPPPPPIPKERLGKLVPEFAIEKLEGDAIQSASLIGKTTVLLFVREHPACEEAAMQVQSVYEPLASDPKFQFFVVANEPRNVSNANIQAMFDRWKVKIPAARESGETTGDALGIESLPTLVILDAKGQLQFTQSFGFGTLATTLPALCEQIAAGEEIHKRLLNIHQQYTERLELAMAGVDSKPIEVKATPIAPSRPPRRLQVSSAWDLPEITKASCITSARIGGERRLIVLESPATLHLISADGKSLGKQKLGIPEGAEIKVIRSAVDSNNRAYFVAFTPGGIAAYLFDDQLKPLGVFPSKGQTHEGVSDALISDLDGKEDIEAYIGFSAFLGVQAVKSNGDRIWRNLAIPSVISIAAGPRNVAGWRKLYATDDRGRIILLNQFGNHELIELQDREIHRLVSRPDPAAEFAKEGDAIFCGVSFQDNDKLLAIGFDSEFSEAWTYDLPPGIFVGPVQYITALPLSNSNSVAWAIAAPDGSMHFIGSRGELEDSMALGERVLGVTTIEIDRNSLLVYATESGLHARNVRVPTVDADVQETSSSK